MSQIIALIPLCLHLIKSLIHPIHNFDCILAMMARLVFAFRQDSFFIVYYIIVPLFILFHIYGLNWIRTAFRQS